MNKKFIYIYIGILFLEIIAGESGNDLAVYILKPCLLSALIVLVASLDMRKHWPFISALLFSLVGDILLMIKLPNLFIFGLGSFLITHVFYISIFRKLATFKPLITITFLSVVAVFFWFVLKPNVPPKLSVPVFFYMTIITAMGITASSVKINKQISYYLAIGATLFIVSDSLIAIDRFVQAIPYPTLLIMSQRKATKNPLFT